MAVSDVFCRHAHYLWARQILEGCATGPVRSCPTSMVSRGQMARFLTGGFGLALYGS